MITIEDIAKLHHKQLNSISAKLLFLMIRNQTDESGWSAISLSDFEKATGMSNSSVSRTLNKLIKTGLIERNPEKERFNSVNQYRTIKP